MDLIKSWYILRLLLGAPSKGKEECQSTQRKQASRGRWSERPILKRSRFLSVPWDEQKTYKDTHSKEKHKNKETKTITNLEEKKKKTQKLTKRHIFLFLFLFIFWFICQNSIAGFFPEALYVLHVSFLNKLRC